MTVANVAVALLKERPLRTCSSLFPFLQFINYCVRCCVSIGIKTCESRRSLLKYRMNDILCTKFLLFTIFCKIKNKEDFFLNVYAQTISRLIDRVFLLINRLKTIYPFSSFVIGIHTYCHSTRMNKK